MRSMDFKKHLTLIIGIAIPVIMVIFVAASIYIPAYFAPTPKFSFLYISDNTYDYRWDYLVRSGTITRIDRNADAKYVQTGDPVFYIYDAAKKESTQISFDEAQKLKLDESPVSPDEYEIVRGNGNGGDFPFDFNGNDYNSFYFRGHNTAFRAKLKTNGNYWNFRFLGWILPS